MVGEKKNWEGIMKIKILIENTTSTPHLKCEHGLSIYIEYNEKRILLDAGSTSAFIDNAKNLNVDLEQIDFLVLSHGHYDHSGGLEEYFKMNPSKKVYAMAGIDGDYYSASGGDIHFIGVPKEVYPTYQGNFVLLKETTKLSDGVYIVPHKNPSELTGVGERAKLFKKQNNEYVPDDFSHELSLVFDTHSGLVIFNSCSHSGIERIIKEVRGYFGEEKKIAAFVGGLHMKGKCGGKEICTFTEKEIEKIVDFIQCNNVEKLYTGHCTGIVGYEMLRKYMENNVEYISTGNEINIV